MDLSANIEKRTDTEPFGLAGIPAIHVFTGLKSPYHKPEDKADLLDYGGMKKVADYTARLIIDLANQPQLAASSTMVSIRSNPNKKIKPISFGLSGFLGEGKHLYKDEFYDSKDEVSYSIGLFANYKISKNWALQLEGLYDENTSRSAKGTFRRQSLLIPLNVEFGSLFFITAGGYYKHHFGGKDGNTILDFDNEYRNKEWGYNYGLGFKYNKLRFGIIQRNSFQSIFQQNIKVIPNAFFFNIGYKF